MNDLQKDTPAGALSGRYAPQFEPLVDAFVRNFEEHGEVGASVCVTLHGETLVDLWGGTKDVKQDTRWQEDTMCVVFSSTKGAVALAARSASSEQC